MTICRSMPYLMIKQTVITNIPPMIPVAIPVPPCYNQYNKRKEKTYRCVSSHLLFLRH